MYLQMLKRILRTFVKKGTLNVIDAGGERHVFSGEPGPQVTVRVHDRALYRRFVVDPDLTAGEAYMDGKVTFEEGSTLRDLFSLYFINQRNLEAHPVRKFFDGVAYRLRRWHLSNRKGEAERHVSHHYDIGNDLYKLFLDETMTYSCAYFRSPDERWKRRSATSSGSPPPSSTSSLASTCSTSARAGATWASIWRRWRMSASPASPCRRSSTNCRTKRRARRASATG